MSTDLNYLIIYEYLSRYSALIVRLPNFINVYTFHKNKLFIEIQITLLHIIIILHFIRLNFSTNFLEVIYNRFHHLIRIFNTDNTNYLYTVLHNIYKTKCVLFARAQRTIYYKMSN